MRETLVSTLLFIFIKMLIRTRLIEQQHFDFSCKVILLWLLDWTVAGTPLIGTHTRAPSATQTP